jgi:hypothetical protein
MNEEDEKEQWLFRIDDKQRVIEISDKVINNCAQTR